MKAETKPVKFVSKYTEHRLVMKPTVKTVVEGVLVTRPGKTIEFRNGEYVTDNRLEINFIQRHRDFGRIINLAVTKKDAEDAIIKKAEELKRKREAKKAKGKK